MRSRPIKNFSMFLGITMLFFATPSFSSEIIVSAASDLTGALREIADAYENESGNRVVINFGSSGILAQQIEGGAPVDIYFSANKRYIDNLENKGLVIPETKMVYAVGRIVLAVPKGASRLDSVKDLTKQGIKRIAIANPGHAPYGMAAKEAMEKTKVWDMVKERIVFGENIRQTMQYLETGDVDAAVLAYALVVNSGINYSLIPQELHTPIEQSMAVIKGRENTRIATEFAKCVNSPVGRRILEKYGFEVPKRVQNKK